MSEAYEREVQESTRRLERRYELARRRAERAEAKLAEATAAPRKGRAGKARLAELAAEVELRREELAEVAAMMMASPASAEHRGTRSFGPVPRSR